MSVRLTPAGQLRWEPAPNEPAPAELGGVAEAMRTDWRGALFTLAAERLPAQELPALRYWQQFAEHYLTALCHLPAAADADSACPLAAPPTAAQCAAWMLTAPPMEGGEYLSPELLQRLWEQLGQWVRAAAAEAGGLTALLRRRAPRWHELLELVRLDVTRAAE